MSDPVALVCVGGSRPDNVASRRWRRRPSGPHSLRAGAIPAARERRPVPGLRRALALLLLGGAGWVGVTAAVAHSGGSTFSRRVGAGCEELEPCSSLEAEAERRLDACALFCDQTAAELSAVRQMRFRAEEKRAVREHYRERDRAERVERERERDERRDDWQRQQEARAAEASREQRHRLEIERLRQEHVDRRLADERQRRVSYFTALGPAGRALRLERCLKRDERCDTLALDLLDAAADDAERRKLAETNEGVARPASEPEMPRSPKPAAPEEPKPDALPAVSGGVEDGAGVAMGDQAPPGAPAAADASAMPSS